MGNIDEALSRLAGDADFRAAVEADPSSALARFNLDDAELAQIDSALRSPPTSMEQFFTPPAGTNAGAAAGPGATVAAPGSITSGGAAPTGGAGASAGLAPWLAVAVLPIGLVVGLIGGLNGWIAGPSPEPIRLAADEFPLYECPATADAAPAEIGTVRRGSELWMIGRGPSGWVALRNPDDLTATAWMRADHVDAGNADLPVMECDSPLEAEFSGAGADAPTTTAAPKQGETTTTTAGSSTSSPEGEPDGGTVPSSSPSTIGPNSPASTAAPPTPPPTNPSDTTPPEVSVSVAGGSSLFYSDNNLGCAPTSLEIDARVTDNSGNAAVDSAGYRFTGRNGTIREGSLTPIGSNRYRLGPISNGAPIDANTPVTVTIRAVDGASNTGSATLTVTLRPYGLDCIG